jgi:branched-chain amino acid aminotransferase
MGVIFLNGEYAAREAATVSVFDHGYLYGDGIFEGIRAYNGRVFRLDEHLDRLYESARTIMLPIPLTKAQVREAVLETLRRNGLRDGYVRLVVSRGPGDLGLDPRKCPQATVVVIAENIQLYPQEAYTRGLRAVTATTRKIRPDMLSPQVKSLNYLGNILARLEVNQAGADEGIMLNAEGYVTECTADNVFIASREELWTPPAYLGILKGITRATVLELARALGIRAEERVFTLHDVYIADECFLTGTAAEVAPVVEVDGRAIGDGRPGALTRRLNEAFRALVQAEGARIYPQETAVPGQREAA